MKNVGKQRWKKAIASSGLAISLGLSATLGAGAAVTSHHAMGGTRTPNVSLRTITVKEMTPAFVQGSALLNPTTAASLRSYASRIAGDVRHGYTLSKVAVLAGTDIAGSVSFNIALGANRASIVAKTLRSLLGTVAHGVTFSETHKLATHGIVVSIDRANTLTAVLIDPHSVIRVASAASNIVGGTYTPSASATSGDTVIKSIDPSSASICSLSAGTVTFLAVGTCVINFTDAGNAQFNAATPVQQRITVDKGTAVITPTNTPTTTTFDSGTFTAAATSTSGDTVVITVDAPSSDVCAITDGVVSDLSVGTCTLDYNDAGNANYNAAAQVQQSFTITPATAVITPTSSTPSIAFVSGAGYQATATSTSGDNVSVTVDPASSSVCTLIDGVAEFLSPGTCTLDFNDSGNANYNAAVQVQQSFTVAKGTSVITPSTSVPQSASFGGATYTPAATSSSGDPVVITVDPSSSAVCTIANGAVSFIGVGVCTVDFNDAGNANFNAANQVQQSFSVQQQLAVITPSTSTPSNATYGGGSYTPAATSTSGDPVVITIDPSSSSVCAISSGVVTYTGVGTCTVDFNDAGSANYLAAAQVQQTFTVSPATAVITPTSSTPNAATVGAGSYTPAATSTSGDSVAVTIDSSSSAVCSISGGVISFTAAGTCTVDFNDAGNANYNAAAQVQQSFTVTAQGSLTVQFTPATSNQYVFFCGPTSTPNSGTVCSNSPSHTINFGQYHLTPVTWTTTIPTGDYFSMTVMAPSSIPPGSIIGPGVGITCIQRGGPNNLVGTVNGVISGDWTGAGAGYFNYWYTGCSFNQGVSSGYFYAETANPV